MTITSPPGPRTERERALGFIKALSGVQGQLRRPPPIGAAPSRRHSFAGLLLAWALFLPWVCCTNLDLCGVRMGPAEIGQVGAACLEARRSAEKYTLRKCLTVLCCCMWGEGATEVTNYSLPCGCS